MLKHCQNSLKIKNIYLKTMYSWVYYLKFWEITNVFVLRIIPHVGYILLLLIYNWNYKKLEKYLQMHTISLYYSVHKTT